MRYDGAPAGVGREADRVAGEIRDWAVLLTRSLVSSSRTEEVPYRMICLRYDQDVLAARKHGQEG